MDGTWFYFKETAKVYKRMISHTYKQPIYIYIDMHEFGCKSLEELLGRYFQSSEVVCSGSEQRSLYSLWVTRIRGLYGHFGLFPPAMIHFYPARMFSRITYIIKQSFRVKTANWKCTRDCLKVAWISRGGSHHGVTNKGRSSLMWSWKLGVTCLGKVMWKLREWGSILTSLVLPWFQF